MNWLYTTALTALSGVLVTWLTGALNRLVPSPSRSFLAIRNLLKPPPPPQDRFRFVLCWLLNDPGGDNNRIVARAFRSVGGVQLVRSARLVAHDGALDDWQSSMRESALAVLNRWHGDVAVVGEVQKSGDVLSLWFVPRSRQGRPAQDVQGTLEHGDKVYTLQASTLGTDFHEHLRAHLAVVAHTAVSPTAYPGDSRNALVQKGLQDGTDKLLTILQRRTIAEPAQRAGLQKALGNAFRILGERAQNTHYLEKAVAALRAALLDIDRERDVYEWAGTQSHLASVLSTLGRRDGNSERLDQAVAAYRAVLVVYTREHSLVKWSIYQSALGEVLLDLGERKSDTAALQEAESAFRAVLEANADSWIPLSRIFAANHLGGCATSTWKAGEPTRIFCPRCRRLSHCRGGRGSGPQ